MARSGQFINLNPDKVGDFCCRSNTNTIYEQRQAGCGMTSNVVRGMEHHREHQSHEIVGIPMKSKSGGIPYGLQARKAPNGCLFCVLTAAERLLYGDARSAKMLLPCGGGAFRRLGKRHPILLP